MSKEEKALALEYLYEMQKNYVEGVGYEEHPLPEWYALESAIKALEQGWIPISEKSWGERVYPKETTREDGYVEPSEPVLITTVSGKVAVVKYWGDRRSKTTEEAECREPEYPDWVEFNHICDGYWDDEVLAWMPLPKPYKPSETEVE